MLFQPDRKVFLHTLARLPAVRQPWLRRIYDRVRQHPYDLFQAAAPGHGMGLPTRSTC